MSKRRLAYTAAASAVSAGLCASDAAAAISYSGIQDISIAQFNKLDLQVDDQDENVDINLKNYIFGGGNYQGATIPFAPGKLVGFQQNGIAYVTALEFGEMIDAAAMGPTFYGAMAYGELNPNGEFDDVTDAYIGLSFPINGTTFHYGWIRVSIDNVQGSFIVHDWAYQTEDSVGILAGDVGTPVELDGDYNEDGTVDAADYVVWRNTNVPTDGYDYWTKNFGTVLEGGGSASRSHAVPEPVTLGLLAAGSLGLPFLRRKRRGTS